MHDTGRRVSRRRSARRAIWGLLSAGAVGLCLLLAACGSSSGASSDATVSIVAAENEYGNVASQIGGPYVKVSSVESNPNTDPHTYEVSPDVAREVSQAGLVIQNGVGYDDFMSRLESASSNSGRRVIDVQHLLGLPDSTPNPHLWYDPATMPKVAAAIAGDLSALEPAHASYFRGRLATFKNGLKPWYAAIAAFKTDHPGTTAATTEPVADYLLQAMGIDNLTPFRFQADIMNGNDPSPQDVAQEDGFFTDHQVKVFCYNQQVVDSLTISIRQHAQSARIPVVAVYETMPAPGYNYQSWMLAETRAITAAVAGGTSTQHL